MDLGRIWQFLNSHFMNIHAKFPLPWKLCKFTRYFRSFQIIEFHEFRDEITKDSLDIDSLNFIISCIVDDRLDPFQSLISSASVYFVYLLSRECHMLIKYFAVRKRLHKYSCIFFYLCAIASQSSTMQKKADRIANWLSLFFFRSL